MAMVFGDNLRRNRLPVATFAIAGVCTLATLATVTLEDAKIIGAFGFIPIELSLHRLRSLYRLFTAEFIHAGAVHLVGNLVFLFAFGRSIENLVGSVAFSAAFISLGALSFLGSWIIGPNSHAPIVGASGALSLVLGAYTVVFPKAKLRIIPFLRTPFVRAWLFATAWVALQAWSIATIGEDASGVAYATHVGGFVIGLVAGVAWKEFALDTDRLIAELSDEASS